MRYDQEEGLFRTIIEEGIPSAIEGRMNSWKNQGYDVEISQDGPYAIGVATRNRFSLDYNYVERWSISTELIQKPIWGLPAVKAEIEAGLFDGWTNAKQYREDIERALTNGTNLPAAYSLYPASSAVLLELGRGADSYEHDYTILTRTVNFDFQVPPNPLQLESNNYIYTTTQLINNENVPADVQFQLPQSDPSTETQAVWGWRIRDQTAEITNATTGTHTTSWVYAQWSTLFYTQA